jgi:hypothetical protein
MVITGKIIDEGGDGIPASVYLSDASGKMSTPALGVNANADGSYKLDVPSTRYMNENEYITAQFVGTTKQTKPLLSTVSFKLTANAALPEIEVSANRIKKPNILKILGITAILTAIGVGIYKYQAAKA